MSTFVQLTREDCSYLLELIVDMDNDTAYTANQRIHTIPKLQKIMTDPASARLAFQDTKYLLELIEDDDLESLEQQREMTRSALQEIQQHQTARFREMQSIDQQRAARRARRSPTGALQEHFQRTAKE